MLQKIKRTYREIKAGDPGSRFVDHYKLSKRRERGGTPWASYGYAAAGVVLVICGFVLSLPPGIPGFLLWIPGLALLAARFKALAMALDRLESWGRLAWERYAPGR